MIRYVISKLLYKSLSEKRDGKGRIIQRFSKDQVIQYLNENGCYLGLITELEIV